MAAAAAAILAEPVDIDPNMQMWGSIEPVDRDADEETDRIEIVYPYHKDSLIWVERLDLVRAPSPYLDPEQQKVMLHWWYRAQIPPYDSREVGFT